MRTVTIINQKGGSAKTTTAVNLSAALGESGKKVLLVDLDPQCSASVWLGSKNDQHRGLFDALTGDGGLEEAIVPTDVTGVDLVPASSWLLGADRLLAREPGSEAILRNKLNKLKMRWDFIIFDLPPSLDLLSISALVASKEVCVPVEPSPIALAGLVQLLRTIQQVKERLNPQLDISGILLCRADSRTNLAKEVEESLRNKFGEKVFKTIIPESVRFRESWGHTKPILTYAPSSAGAEAYRSVGKEFLERGLL